MLTNCRATSTLAMSLTVIGIILVSFAIGLTLLRTNNLPRNATTGANIQTSSSSLGHSKASVSVDSVSGSLWYSSSSSIDSSTTTSLFSESDSTKISSSSSISYTTSFFSQSTTSSSTLVSTSSSTSSYRTNNLYVASFAGYETFENYPVISVRASWIVPNVNCTSVPSTSYYNALMWVGISDVKSVEQIGTESNCWAGSPFIAAWYAFYPRTGNTFIRHVSPGDNINAKVTYSLSSKQYTLMITDSSAGWTQVETGGGGANEDAMWIVEAPKPSPLSNFGSITFVSCGASMQNGASTMVTGILPGSSGGGVDRYIMTRNNAQLANTGQLIDGGSFTVTWQNSQ